MCNVVFVDWPKTRLIGFKLGVTCKRVALGLGLGLGLGGLLLIGLVAYLCVSKKKQPSTSTREQDVENEMVKTGAAMS